jgi:hypothetical protein
MKFIPALADTIMLPTPHPMKGRSRGVAGSGMRRGVLRVWFRKPGTRAAGLPLEVLGPPARSWLTLDVALTAFGLHERKAPNGRRGPAVDKTPRNEHALKGSTPLDARKQREARVRTNI